MRNGRRPPGWQRLTAEVARRRLPGWDATCGVVIGAEGVLVVDTGATVAEGAEVRRAVTDLADGRRPGHVALTHPHFDHVFGVAAFAGAAVYGAAGLPNLLSHDREALRADAVRHGVPASSATEASELLVAPTREVARELSVDLGGLSVVLANVGPGHTGHDLAVLVPGEPRVVFCGDLVEESGEPQAGPDAVPSRWPAALDRLLALGGEEACYVPGHGAVVDAPFVRSQRDALTRRFDVGR